MGLPVLPVLGYLERPAGVDSKRFSAGCESRWDGILGHPGDEEAPKKLISVTRAVAWIMGFGDICTSNGNI